MAAERARGGTLYCTLEPCCHTGRTGPCVARIVEAGIGRVVASVEDPDPRVAGRGFEYLRSQGVDVQVGLGAAAAVTLNQPFFTLVRRRRPFVVLKAAVSLDGCVAARRDSRTLLTSQAANRHAHRYRAEVDALGVGVGTVLSDDPLLTARGPFRRRPLTRIIFDRRLRMPPDARVLSTGDAGPVMIVTTADGAANSERCALLKRRGAEVVVAEGPTFGSALAVLGSRQIASLLLEGGAAVHGAAWDEGLVDFVRLYVTPHVIGTTGIRFLEGRSFSTGTLTGGRVEPIGPDVLIEGYVHGPR
jgi:diaminohydroxyphosphoribosylaminopyrimidine deaminase/5-amino-6-(5-phosphoribosylamino)uracil reductase